MVTRLIYTRGKMLNIVLADDHKVVRKGLKALLSTEADFSIVGEAENGREALDLVEELKPDILVLDLMMPVINGLEVLRTISNKPCRTRIVILSMHNCEAYVAEAFRMGAYAYILKESPPEELIAGIRKVAEGSKYLSGPLNNHNLAIGDFEFRIEANRSIVKLTPREEEIHLLDKQGLSNVEIAAKLGISPRTVETHRSNLNLKLKSNNPV
jgi:DNA-binding NarL/FixJ family response regulator